MSFAISALSIAASSSSSRSLTTPVELVDVDLLTNNCRLDCFAAALERGLSHEHGLLRTALAERKEFVAFLIRVEEDVARSEEVENTRLRLVEEEEASGDPLSRRTRQGGWRCQGRCRRACGRRWQVYTNSWN